MIFFLHKRYILLTQHVHEEVVEVAIQDVPRHSVVLVRYLNTRDDVTVARVQSTRVQSSLSPLF